MGGKSFLVIGIWAVWAGATQPAAWGSVPALSSAERSRVRYRLENLFNELDLLIRNRRADEADLRRQERDFDGLRVFERIPFRDDIQGARSQLAESAARAGLRLEAFEIEGRIPPKRRLPRSLYTDSPAVRLRPEDVSESIRVALRVRGKQTDVRRWSESWRDDLLRLFVLERETPELPEAIRRAGPGEKDRWIVSARMFRFPPLRFPRLKPRDPLEILPDWARRDTGKFARAEPELWKWVGRIRRIAPAAKPLYGNRERFLLNGARMDFFLAKAGPPSQTKGYAP